MTQIKITRHIGGESVVISVSKASWHTLRRKVEQLLRPEQKTNASRASKVLEHSDEQYEQYRADSENNLIDGRSTNA